MGQTLSICQKNRADWIQSQQTIPGESTQRQCHFAESLLFWRGYWPWQKGDAEFALINAKVPLQSQSGVFPELLFLLCVMNLAYFSILLENYFSPACGISFFMARSFCQSHWFVCLLWLCVSPRCSECTLYCVSCCTAISVLFLIN